MPIEDFCIICNHYHPDEEIAIGSDSNGETMYALNKADCNECDCSAKDFDSEDDD